MSNQLIHDSETPAAGQQVITACAFIHRRLEGEHQLFLAKRAATKKFLPDVYELPGGHIDFGEDLVAGLQREILEEFQMNVRVGDPFAAFAYHNPVKGSHSVEVIYFAQFEDPIEKIRFDASDHSGFGWFSKKELPEIEDQAKGVPGDPEWSVIYRGFDLLEGRSLRFGTN